MAKLNVIRKGCKDVWNSFLVTYARFAGLFEFPIIQPCYDIPNKLIAFSKAQNARDFNQWIHFYEDDYLFERIWANPNVSLKKLKKFNGVILPDFSVYRDMPLVMQLWNIYRSRALGFWLQLNGVKVIVNVRYGDKRTWLFCCDGVPKNCTIAVGTHGTLKNSEDRLIFIEGLRVVVKRIKPAVIVVYGSAPESIFSEYRNGGIQIVQFDSAIAQYYKAAQ